MSNDKFVSSWGTESGMPIMDLQHIEWHDARIERIKILPEGKNEVIFKHICSYHKLESGKTEVWSSRAVVGLTGVTGLNIDNSISDENIDGELLDSFGQEVSLIPIGAEKAVTSFDVFVTGAGTNIKISAKTAVLVSLEPIEYLEDWIE